jgi:hypothetical protein
MQIHRTIRATTVVLALLACLAAPLFAPAPALAQQAAPADTSQTKTDPSQPATPAAEAPPPPALAAISDDAGLLAFAAPPAWDDVAQGEWRLLGAPAGRRLSAAPDQAEFAANWGTPGITLYHSTSLPAAMEPEDVLAVFDFSNACQNGGRGALAPGERSAIYQIWHDCAGAGTAAAVLVVYPTAERTFYGVIEVYLADTNDLAALGPILASVRFGDPAGDTAAGETAAGETAAPSAAATLPPPTPAPTAAPTPTPALVLASVITDRLNLRSGPSTEVERLTVVTRGMQLTVLGQLDNCAWLRVTAPDGAQGWVSGDPQYTSLGAPCETIPAAENP